MRTGSSYCGARTTTGAGCSWRDQRELQVAYHARAWPAACGGIRIETIALVLFAAWALGFGALAGIVARHRARNQLLWIGYGAVLGPIATLILRSAPPGHCPTCLEPTRGWLFVCARCRSDLRPTQASATAAAAQPRSEPDGKHALAGATDAKSGDVPAGAADPEAARAVEQASDAGLVASGVYVGGMAPLMLGSRYSLIVRGETFEVMGPVDSAPDRVVVSRGLDTVDATVIGGRLLVTGVGSERARFALAFERLSGAADELLEAALTRSSARNETGDRP